MIAQKTYCYCCGNTLPNEAFRVLTSQSYCQNCLSQSIGNALTMMRNTCEREHNVLSRTKDSRRQAHAELRQRSYAEHGKRCGCCHMHKPPADYNKCASRSDGLQANSRACDTLRLHIIAEGGGTAVWRTVRDALRAKAAELALQK